MTGDISVNREALLLTGIRKSFGAVQALQGVDLSIREGSVHGLIGENGAGKSTLMKILSGAYRPDAGHIKLYGTPYTATSPAQGRTAGIAMIYQEPTLAPHLTVHENITLGIEHSQYGFVRARHDNVREALTLLGHGNIDINARVGTLSISLQQVVEIARGLISDAKLIIMDEPTSSLSATDARELFNVVRRLRAQRITVIYISHFLEEVKGVCDTYTVLRDGRTVAAGNAADISVRGFAELMVGRSHDMMYGGARHEPAEHLFSVRGLQGAPIPNGVSLDLRRGEILGVSGLVGSGRSETVRCLFGLNQASDGTITIAGHDELRAACLSPCRALQAGCDLLSENRQDEGLAQKLSVSVNITLSGLARYRRSLFLRPAMECAATRRWCEKLAIKCSNVSAPVSSLSGGNQQRVAIARLLHRDCDILFLDEPTKGIDVGSKAEIYRLVRELAARGKAIVIISSYLPELLGICDTIMVMHRGLASQPRPACDWTERDIMVYATSGKEA